MKVAITESRRDHGQNELIWSSLICMKMLIMILGNKRLSIS
jgi:hypothetical protein